MTSNVYNEIADHIVRDFIFGERLGFRFSVAKLKRIDSGSFLCENVIFDNQFIVCDKSTSIINLEDYDDVFTLDVLKAHFPVAPINSTVEHSLDFIYDLKDNEIGLKETTLYYHGDEKEETTYEGYMQLGDSNKAAIIVVTPVSKNPSFVVVLDEDIELLDDDSVMSMPLFDVIAGVSGNVDSRNFKFDIERTVSKLTRDMKLSSPLYNMRRIDPEYKNEMVSYDNDGEVTEYRNNKTGVYYERVDCGKFIKHTTMIKNTVVQRILALKDENESIYIDTFNCSATIYPTGSGNKVKYGAIHYDADIFDYQVDTFGVRSVGDSNEPTAIESDALAILRTLQRPVVSGRDANDTTVEYADGTYLRIYRDGDKTVTEIHKEDGELIYTVSAYTGLSEVSKDIEKELYDPNTNCIAYITDVHDTYNDITAIYNLNGLQWKASYLSSGRTYLMMNFYEDKTITVKDNGIFNHVLRTSKYAYVRGAYGVPHKYTSPLIVQDLI